METEVKESEVQEIDEGGFIATSWDADPKAVCETMMHKIRIMLHDEYEPQFSEHCKALWEYCDLIACIQERGVESAKTEFGDSLTCKAILGMAELTTTVMSRHAMICEGGRYTRVYNGERFSPPKDSPLGRLHEEGVKGFWIPPVELP